jgi:hypothetical protein
MASMARQAVIGFRSHSGWAAAIAVAGSPFDPLVLDRARLITCDPALNGSKQPYHTAQKLTVNEADAFIQRCEQTSIRLAKEGILNLIARLETNGDQVRGTTILTGPVRKMPDLAAILKSHALLHSAEGEFYRNVIVRACEPLPVMKCVEREIWDRAAHVFLCDAQQLQRKIGGIGKTLGPPWREDEKLAALAGWIGLAASGMKAAGSVR